jgi:hypothetical protein
MATRNTPLRSLVADMRMASLITNACIPRLLRSRARA